MLVHLIHGFNVRDGGNRSIGTLRDHFVDLGRVVMQRYGWVGLLRLRRRNERAARMILPWIEEGDILVGHSNGCLICWQLVQAGAKPSMVICIQPALRRDTQWPEDIPVLCCHSPHDWIVELGRIWGRFWSVANPWRQRHGWGAAGRHGFDPAPNIVNVNTAAGTLFPARWHSSLFRPSIRAYWGCHLAGWARRMLATRSE